MTRLSCPLKQGDLLHRRRTRLCAFDSSFTGSDRRRENEVLTPKGCSQQRELMLLASTLGNWTAEFARAKRSSLHARTEDLISPLPKWHLCFHAVAAMIQAAFHSKRYGRGTAVSADRGDVLSWSDSRSSPLVASTAREWLRASPKLVPGASMTSNDALAAA